MNVAARLPQTTLLHKPNGQMRAANKMAVGPSKLVITDWHPDGIRMASEV